MTSPTIIAAFASRSRDSRWFTALRASALHHRWLAAVVLSYVLAVVLTLTWLGRDYELFNWIYLASAAMPLVCWAVFLLLGSAMQCVAERRAVSPANIGRIFRASGFFTVERIAYVVFPLGLLQLFSSAFSSFKSSITAIHPFTFDVALWKLDRWLHFGYDPWRLLQPLLGEPVVTSAISYLYNLWFPLLYIFLYVLIFRSSEQQLRMRYMLTFAAIWILVGSLMALGFSSAGPCYFGLVTGLPDPYAPLFSYLSEANEAFRVWSIDGQAYLWKAYDSAELTTGGGISAMPSMHVAVATLQALAGWKLDRKLGLLLGAYALVIMTGSVHLGWHYAVDGYVSLLCAIFLWVAIGYLLGSRRFAAYEPAAA